MSALEITMTRIVLMIAAFATVTIGRDIIRLDARIKALETQLAQKP